jgi:hypothetical protein
LLTNSKAWKHVWIVKKPGKDLLFCHFTMPIYFLIPKLLLQCLTMFYKTLKFILYREKHFSSVKFLYNGIVLTENVNIRHDKIKLNTFSLGLYCSKYLELTLFSLAFTKYN